MRDRDPAGRRVSTARAQRRRADRQKARQVRRAKSRIKPWQQALVAVLAAGMILGAIGWSSWGYVDDRWFSGTRVLATVGDLRITAAEVGARGRLWGLLAMWRGPVGQEELLEEMIEERLVSLEAAARDLLPADAAVKSYTDQVLGSLEDWFETAAGVTRAMRSARVTRAHLEEMVRGWLAAGALFEEITGAVTVTPEEVAAHYQEHMEDYAVPREVTVRHILVETEAQAREILELLEGGTDFSSLAASRSLDPGTRDQGGLLPWTITPGDPYLAPEFVAAAVELAEGETSSPVKTQFGVHLIRAETVTPGRQPSFEEVESEVAQDLLASRRQAIFDAWFEEHKGKMPVTYGP
ncbi:MAG: peptidyl-prolyl cis-trans isomerase [bacterium]|nr:peptidyl-prolyl cis-trans isomerase [bacterium]